jgi:lactoylglutathione lyase
MTQTISHVTYLVQDYDEALAFFIEKLGFQIIEDTRLSSEKRWVVVRPPGSNGAALLLAKAATPEQASRIGNQTGGRVCLFLDTGDFWHDYRQMHSRGVEFLGAPREESYGTVVVFVDLYGNKWDLIQHRDEATST